MGICGDDFVVWAFVLLWVLYGGFQYAHLASIKTQTVVIKTKLRHSTIYCFTFRYAHRLTYFYHQFPLSLSLSLSPLLPSLSPFRSSSVSWSPTRLMLWTRSGSSLWPTKVLSLLQRSCPSRSRQTRRMESSMSLTLELVRQWWLWWCKLKGSVWCLATLYKKID